MVLIAAPKHQDFVDLELHHHDKHFRVQRSATLSNVMRRSALPGIGGRPADPSVLTVDPMSCRPKWKWPEEHATSVPEFWRTRVTDVPQRSWNVVPFRALVYAFVMDADARKIFGNLGQSNTDMGVLLRGRVHLMLSRYGQVRCELLYNVYI